VSEPSGRDSSGLAAVFGVDRPAFRLRFELRAKAGSITAVVGPNGSGKTTTLRTLAGLIRPHTGSIRLDGRILDDADTGVHVSPAGRGAGVVFQDYLLFPHLTAAENVAFGLIAHGASRRTALAEAKSWLDRFALADFAGVRPAQLSGGEAQRVALARALILEPPLLLLDEPMAALDASTRVDVRTDLATQLRSYDGVTILVTHDPKDALAIADTMLVLEAGAIVQTGTPLSVARAPATAYVAGLFA
jgi:molybdate transport system ATP-binding protein